MKPAQPDPGSAWSMPLDAPLSPPFPFAFRNADILTLTYRTDPAAIRRMVPAPLVPVNDWVLIHVYNMNDVDWLGRYGECNVMVGARSPDGTVGGYSPFLFLNSDGGLAQGREVHGQPKKWANPRVEFRNDLIVGVVERNGIDLVTGTMVYKHTRSSIDELKARTFDFALGYNLKLIPQIDGSRGLRQITARRLSDVCIHECWSDPCSVDLRPNMQAPLHLLPVRECGAGWFWRADFTLVPGTIVHTYP